MSKEFDFDELEKFIKSWQKVMAKANFEEFLKGFLLEMAQRAVADIKGNTPRMTGALINSWTISAVTINGGNLEVEIINNQNYASFVEYGHRQTPGRYVPAIGKRLVNEWVEGRFMMTFGMDRIEKQMPYRFKKSFQEYLRSKGAV